MIEGKTLEQWQAEYPLLELIRGYEPVLWASGKTYRADEVIRTLPFGQDDVLAAETRLRRFAPYIARIFPETESKDGIIESPLTGAPDMKQAIEGIFRVPVEGKLFVKEDNKLAVSGSIKARGGIYEVLKRAEDLALSAGMISEDEDYSVFAEDRFKEYFSQYSIVCGSTGNLGLSIGIMSAELGFNVTIHMSDDARAWKKDMLRSKGVNVVEHSDDYSKAVEQGRLESERDPKSYFVDDENSKTLFFGYAVAAVRLKEQLAEQNITVDGNHPLNVYLPCGVGGGPGGIAFGLKVIFGDDVHCYFAEPVHSPCMLIGMMTGYHDRLSVADFGLDNKTAADGLAVGRPSGFVGRLLEGLVAGVYTVSDNQLFRLLALARITEGLKLEPSAVAGFMGPAVVQNDSGHTVHIAWSTGGEMVPESVWQEYYETGKAMLN